MPAIFRIRLFGMFNESTSLGSVINIRPTPVSRIKLKGPLLLILSWMMIISLTILNGMVTCLRLSVKSKYWALAVERQQQNNKSRIRTRNAKLRQDALFILWYSMINNGYI